MSFRGRRSISNFNPRPVNTPKPAPLPLPRAPDAYPGTMRGAGAPPPPQHDDCKDEAVRRLQQKYDADAKVAAEKKRVKRLEELEKKLPTEMEGRILATGEAGCAIYAKKGQDQGTLSLKEKEEQRMRSIRHRELQYQHDAKIEEERKKLLEEKKRAAKLMELEKITKAMEGQRLDSGTGRANGDHGNDENNRDSGINGMPPTSEDGLKRGREQALKIFQEKYEQDANKRARKSDAEETMQNEAKRVRLAELEALLKHGTVIDVELGTGAGDTADN